MNMLGSLITFLLTFFTNNLAGILVGMFIGWHIPMPDWAKTFYSDAVDWFFGLFKTGLAWLWSKVTGK